VAELLLRILPRVLVGMRRAPLIGRARPRQRGSGYSVKPITPKERPAAGNVVDLMEALLRSVGKDGAPAKATKPAKKPRKAASGQKEMLMPISGKKQAKETVAKKAGG
jgi:hypothetical protein